MLSRFKILAYLTIIIIILFPIKSFACQFDTDCAPGCTCLKAPGSLYGVCYGCISPGNSFDKQPVYSPTDPSRTYGNTCLSDGDCGIRMKCIKSGSVTYGVCLRASDNYKFNDNFNIDMPQYYKKKYTYSPNYYNYYYNENKKIYAWSAILLIIIALLIIYYVSKKTVVSPFQNYNQSFYQYDPKKSNNKVGNESATWIKTGMGLFESGRYTDAIIAFRKALDLGIKTEMEGFLIYLIGICFIKLDSYDKAIQALNIAITKGLFKKEADAWLLKGICYINLNEYEKAAMSLIKAIELEVQHKFEALYMIGVIFIILERYGEAIQVLDQVIEFGEDKDKANCWYLKGLCLIKLGFQKEAEEAFNFSKKYGLKHEPIPEINTQILAKGLKIFCQKIIDEFY